MPPIVRVVFFFIVRLTHNTASFDLFEEYSVFENLLSEQTHTLFTHSLLPRAVKKTNIVGKNPAPLATFRNYRRVFIKTVRNYLIHQLLPPTTKCSVFKKNDNKMSAVP